MQNFQALGAPPPDPRASGGWGLCPQTPNCLWRLGASPPDPQNSPLNCEFLATHLPHFALFIIIWVFVAFVWNNFSSSFSCKLYDIINYNRCMLNFFWLKSFICITHCVTLIPSCYIALSYLFAKA